MGICIMCAQFVFHLSVNAWMKKWQLYFFLIKGKWPWVALEWPFASFRATGCRNAEARVFFCVSAKLLTKSINMPLILFLPSFSHFYFFFSTIPYFHLWPFTYSHHKNPFIHPYFRSTGWRWVVWAKRRCLFHAGRTVHSREVRMAPQTRNARNRPSPSCSRKSSSSPNRLRSNRQPGMTTLLSTSSWPTMPINSRAHASNR